MKKNNTQNRILKELFENPNLSRVDLSNILNINKSTISTNVQKLLDSNFLKETDKGESTPKGGKKPINLMLNYNKKVFLGFDISKNYISYALTNLNLDIIKYGTKDVTINKENIYEEITTIIDSLQNFYLDGEENKLFSISISIHGIVFKDKITFTPNYDLDESDFFEKLKSENEGINFYLINEANYYYQENGPNYVRNADLAEAIKYYGGASTDPHLVAYVEELREVERILRNPLAHQMVSFSNKEVKKLTGLTVKDINSKLRYIAVRVDAINMEDFKVYDEMNERLFAEL